MANNNGSIAIRVDSFCMMRVCATVLSDGTTLHTRFGFGAAMGGDIGLFPRDGRVIESHRVRSCIHTSPDPVTRRYDALQRLTTATRILGGAVTYSYSPSGNILSKSDYGSSYGYPANGCGPHAAELASKNGTVG